MLHELHQSACNKHFAPTIPQPPTMSYTVSRLILRIFSQIPEIQKDKRKSRDFYKLLFIRLLLCTKIQGTYFKISALCFFANAKRGQFYMYFSGLGGVSSAQSAVLSFLKP